MIFKEKTTRPHNNKVNQESLNKNDIQLNLWNVFFISLFNELNGVKLRRAGTFLK